MVMTPPPVVMFIWGDMKIPSSELLVRALFQKDCHTALGAREFVQISSSWSWALPICWGRDEPCRCAINSTFGRHHQILSLPQAAALRMKGGGRYNHIQTSAPQEAQFMVNKKYVCPVASCLLPRKRRFQQFKITKTGKIHGFQLSPVCLRLSKLLVILILNLQSTTRTGAMQIGCLRVSLVTLLVQTLDNGNESF